MFHVYLVRINADPVGVVARDAEGFRFYAISRRFESLEPLIFDSAEDARSAALVLTDRP